MQTAPLCLPQGAKMSAHPANVTVPPMFCRGCGYNLHALTTPRCPECGRPFDPQSPRTFRKHPPRPWHRQLLRIGVPVLLLILVPTALGTWLYQGWKFEHDTMLAPHPFSVEATRPLGGAYLKSHIGALGQYLDRASSVTGGGQETVTLDDFQAIGQFHYLQQLEICSPDVTDANSAQLAGLTRLVTLHLYCTELTDAGLLNLRHIRHLQELQITGQDFTGSALAQLDLRDLRSLTLGSKRLNDAVLPALAGCTHLETLALRDSRVTDAGLLNLRNLHNLRGLGLESPLLTGRTLAELDLRNLKELGLTRARISDPLPALPASANLQSIGIEDGTLGDAALRDLKSLPDLRHLNLSCTTMSDAALAPLAECTHLESLWLTQCPITDAGLQHLKGLKSLKRIDLYSTRTSNQAVADLQSALPGLTIRH